MAHVDTNLSRNVTLGFLEKNVMMPMDYKEEDADKGNMPDGLLELFEISDCVIAVNDPANFQPLDDLARIIEAEDYQIVLATKDAILSAINLSFDHSQDSAEQIVQDMLEDPHRDQSIVMFAVVSPSGRADDVVADVVEHDVRADSGDLASFRQ